MGITDLFDCAWISSGISAGIAVTSVSTGNVVGVLGVSVMILGVIPGMDFLVAELSEMEIVLKSLEDCVGAVDTVRSLKNAISSFEEQFCMDFSEKSLLVGAFFVELLHSLEANVSEML